MRVRLERMASNCARGGRRLIQQERNGDVAPAAQTLRIDSLRLLTVRATIDEEVHHCVKIVIIAVEFVRNARQVFRLHQLKLMTNRRDDAFVTLARVVDEIAAAALHFLFDYATPADSMIYQFAVPLVIIESDLALFESLLRRFAFAPASLPSSSSNSPSLWRSGIE